MIEFIDTIACVQTTLDEWEILQAVVQLGSFASAAEKLNRSQSTISYAMARLQERLGIKLFEIKGRKAQLTETGRTLFADAEPLLAGFGQLEQRARSLVSGGDSEIRLSGPCCESVTGVSNNGILSGLVFQSDFFMAWMKEATDQDFFTYPHGGTQCCDTNGTAINNNIDMIGFTGAQGWFTQHIEVNEVESSGEVTPQFINVNFPGHTSAGAPLPSYPFGMNDKRWIVGAYIDGANHMHGFVAKPNF